jgi:hypothetical protein
MDIQSSYESILSTEDGKCSNRRLARACKISHTSASKTITYYGTGLLVPEIKHHYHFQFEYSQKRMEINVLDSYIHHTLLLLIRCNVYYLSHPTHYFSLLLQCYGKTLFAILQHPKQVSKYHSPTTLLLYLKNLGFD